MEIIPGIHQIQVPIPDNPLGHLNSYLVAGKDGWYMIDTGWFTPEAFDSLVGSLKNIGVELTDIATIIITHVHADHFGLAGRIRQVSPNTKLLLHHWEADLIESRYIKMSDLREKSEALLRLHGVPAMNAPRLRDASMPTLPHVIVTMPDQTLYGGEIIDTGKFQLETIWTPGHSPGHLCLFEPKNKILFSGDHILPVITPSVSYHPQSGDDPLGDFLCALRKLAHMKASQVLPAHEHIFTDLGGRIKQLLEHHVERENEIRQAIAVKPASAYDISAQITWHVPGMTWEQFPPYHKRSAVFETLAHLEHMRWEGAVDKHIDEGRILYAAI